MGKRRLVEPRVATGGRIRLGQEVPSAVDVAVAVAVTVGIVVAVDVTIVVVPVHAACSEPDPGRRR